MAGEARPVGRGFALLDPLLRRPAPVVEVDDGPIGPGQGGHDEADPREQLAGMVLDFCIGQAAYRCVLLSEER